ncbi:MAG: DUF1553 domain-containing protein, partial [Planctomycetaceae bacterium]|nr:DUF1553 domain-containing protein [Planctomycetaceae bacterium]
EEKAKENPEAMEKLAIAKATPKYLDGDEVEAEDGAEARKKLAEWVTKDNDWFARTTANRIWGHYMKRGFVEPVDDFSEININSNPELLAYVARDFASHGYDLRRLMRIILMTRAYQLSSDLSANNKDDLLYYSRAYVEQLSAVQVFGALASATGAEKAGSEKMSKDKLAKTKFALLRQFTTTFEDDEGKEIESFTGTIPQALMMMNGEFVTKVASAFPGGTLHTIFKTHKSPEDRIDAMYLAALCRKPLSTERSKMLNYLNGENSTVAAYEDIFWALLNSAEFLNNH